MSTGLSHVQAPSGAYFHASGDDVPDAIAPLFEVILRAGQRGAHGAAVSRGLVAYWQALSRVEREQRAGLLSLVRDAVRRGGTSPRAWTCIALGDPDFDIVREATAGYLGAPAASVERRGQCVADVIDWITRALPLNRAAAFAALLDLNDALLLEQLAGFRGRLSRAEAAAVWAAFAGTPSPAIGEFIAQWCGEEGVPG